MNINKLFSSIGIVVVIGLAIYFFYSGQRSTSRIKNLTNALQATQDSLILLNVKYDSLHVSYEVIYNSLSHTRSKLKRVKDQLDSAGVSNANQLRLLSETLHEIIEKHDTLVSADTTKTAFRLE